MRDVVELKAWIQEASSSGQDTQRRRPETIDMEAIYPEPAQAPYQHRNAGGNQRQERNPATQRLRLPGRRIP